MASSEGWQEKREAQRRFYYVRMTNVRDVNKKMLDGSNTVLKVEFRIGDALSDTKFKVDKSGSIGEDRARIQEESHMFHYSSNETMEVRMYRVQKQKEKEPPKSSQKQLLNDKDDDFGVGYMNILLTPFIEEPHTRHTVYLNMKLADKSNRLDRTSLSNSETAGIVTIEVFFLMKFEAQLKIIPVQAHLKNNLAELGQLRPRVFMYLNGQVKKSFALDSGGIHPCWNQFAKKKREAEKQRREEEKQRREEEKQQDGKAKEEEPKLGGKVRNEVEEAEMQMQANIFTFDLTSVAHELKIQVVNFPLYGADPDVIGETNIRLELKNFFRTPNVLFEHYEQDTIQLSCWQINESKKKKELVSAGSIDIASMFIYDAKKVRAEVDAESEDESPSRIAEPISARK